MFPIRLPVDVSLAMVAAVTKNNFNDNDEYYLYDAPVDNGVEALWQAFRKLVYTIGRPRMFPYEHPGKGYKELGLGTESCSAGNLLCR